MLTFWCNWSGRPGWFPTPGPHGAGRAQLRHPALQAMNSLVTARPRPCAAIRCRRVEMVIRARCPWHLSLQRSHGPAPPSLHGVPRVGSPASRYYSTLRLPSTRPAALRCLRLAVSRPHPLFAPLAAGCPGQGPGVGHPVLPPGLAEKTKGPPRFLENPRERALFFDPGGIAGARPLRRRDAAFRCVNDVGSRDDVDFGAQSHGPLTRCLRFAVPVTRTPRKTRFRLLAKLCRAGLVTRRVPSKGFRVTLLPPFPSFPGALTRRPSTGSTGVRRCTGPPGGTSRTETRLTAPR